MLIKKVMMMNKNYRFQVDITLLSPVMSQSQQGTQLGIDTEAFQLEHNGKLYPALPSSLIRGNLLHSWKKLAKISNNRWINNDEIEKHLGQDAITKNNQPQRAGLRSSDSWIAKEETEASTLHRIKIDKETGVVGKGMLQTLTAPHPVGKKVVYSGWFEVTTNEEKLQDLHDKINKGFRFIPALGAFKGVGFGRILDIEVSSAVACKIDSKIEIEDASFSIELTLDRPICFAKPHPADSNRFESSDSIPGGAIKGAIANRIKQLNDSSFDSLLDNLENIRFTHAHPCLAKNTKKQRASAIPLSLYFASYGDKDRCYDASNESTDTTLQHGNIRFQSDWKQKHYDAIDPHVFTFNEKDDTKKPKHSLRVRTRIDAATNASKDEALFSVDALHVDKHIWLANISLEAFEGDLLNELKVALQTVLSLGLNSLGKTRAQTSNISIAEPKPFVLKHDNELLKNNQVRILLQSDTLLFEDDLNVSATNGATALKKAYHDSWDKLSNHSLKLNNYFAQQSLYGGDYYWRRFCANDEIYNPLIVTKAGSIFIFDVINGKENEAKEILSQWEKKGISLPDKSLSDWHKNPLVANNGYGEVSISPQTKSLCNVEVSNDSGK